MVKVDPDKLRAELRRRGLNVTAVSTEMGYNSTYMTNVLKTGSIALPAANQLELRYNIDMSLMKPDAKVEEKAPDFSKATEEVNTLKEEIQELTKTVKGVEEEFRNYRTAMLQYMKKFENYRKYGHM